MRDHQASLARNAPDALPATPKRVLFVDDDENILQALRNLFRRDRARWEISYALGGEAAMAEMNARPADVVVSDMRMPGMDGAALLGWIQREHPAATRIILSGHADRAAILSAIPVTHQFLPKPCEPQKLRAMVERTFNLQRLLRSEPLRAAISRLDALPPAPRTYLAITAAMLDPRCGLADIADIVEQDASLSAKTLQLVNSAFFNLPQPTASVRQAVTYLGLEQLKGAALSAYVFGHLPPLVAGLSFDDVQRQGAVAARLARQLLSDPERREQAFTAAIVHDVGLIALAVGQPRVFEEIVQHATEPGVSLRAAEEAALGVSHAEIGGYLLGVWGLPMPVVEAVCYHQRPSAAGDAPLPVLAAVHAADVVVDRLGDRPVDTELDVGVLARAGIAVDPAGWTRLARDWLAAGGGAS